MSNDEPNLAEPIIDNSSIKNSSDYYNYYDELATILELYYDIQPLFESDIDDDDDDDEETQAINNSFHEESPYKKVFDIENNKNLLKHTCYNKDVHINASCPIYVVDFNDDTEVVELPCGHCFIPEAIYEWLENQSHCCPFCRYELPSKETKTDISPRAHSPEIYPDRPANAFDVANIQNNETLLDMISELINSNNF